MKFLEAPQTFDRQSKIANPKSAQHQSLRLELLLDLLHLFQGFACNDAVERGVDFVMLHDGVDFVVLHASKVC